VRGRVSGSEAGPERAQGVGAGWRRCWVLLAGMALIAPVSGTAAGTAAAATRASTAWKIQATPDVTVPAGQVQAVSCPSASACTAVGYYLDPAGRYVPLAETWNGTSWAQETAPSPAGAQVPGLDGVSCRSASFCEAVGVPNESGSASTMFADRWNGSAWTLQSMPSPAGATTVLLKAVSCASTSFCEAVGSYTSAGTILSLAEEWNGTAWALQSTPNQAGEPTQLDGVSCVSATFCEAADFYGALTEQWNGTSWIAQTVPYPSGMINPSVFSVSCPSPTSCEAVGLSSNPDSAGEAPFAVVWNGASWQDQSVPNPGAIGKVLQAVSCASAAFCEAVGYQEVYVSGTDTFHALADVWRAGAWHLQQPPSGPGAELTDLTGVSCPAATACEAGGFLPVRMEVWNGTSWAVQQAVNPPGAVGNTLDGASCVTATFCEAVGYDAGPHLGLTEAWNGSAWTIQPDTVTMPAFTAVSCVTVSFCAAVGSLTGDATALWNGTSWQPQSAPGDEYSAVSCASATFCVAVGPNAAMWDGTSWSAASLPAITDGDYTGVSCVAATACEAVGSSSTGKIFAAGWNGTAWTAQTAPAPSGATRISLSKISCVTANACEAVGNSTAGAYSDAWNGTAWTLQAMLPVPSGAHAIAPADVTCTSATACIVAGSSTWTGSPEQTLIEAWDGTSWSVQPTPNSGTGNNELNSVSCVTAGPCVAVGTALDPGGYSATLAEATS
jgi:hypothetical protein